LARDEPLVFADAVLPLLALARASQLLSVAGKVPLAAVPTMESVAASQVAEAGPVGRVAHAR
jgi:hypothetical protein